MKLKEEIMDSKKGIISMLGNASILNAATQYSIIDIGGNVLQNYVISNSLDNYLQKACSTGTEVTIWISGKFIYGVEFPDGKIFFSKFKVPRKTLFLLILSIPLMIILLGFIIAAFCIGEYIGAASKNAQTSELKNRGGVAIETFM